MCDSLWFAVRRLYRWCKLRRCHHLIRRAVRTADADLGRRAVAAAVRVRAEMLKIACQGVP